MFDPLLGIIDYWRLDTCLEGLSSRQGEKKFMYLMQYEQVHIHKSSLMKGWGGPQILSWLFQQAPQKNVV